MLMHCVLIQNRSLTEEAAPLSQCCFFSKVTAGMITESLNDNAVQAVVARVKTNQVTFKENCF